MYKVAQSNSHGTYLLPDWLPVKLLTFGGCAFSMASPTVWNSLPVPSTLT